MPCPLIKCDAGKQEINGSSIHWQPSKNNQIMESFKFVFELKNI